FPLWFFYYRIAPSDLQVNFPKMGEMGSLLYFLSLPAPFPHINPFFTPRILFQFLHRQIHGAVSASCRRIHPLEAFQGFVQINRDAWFGYKRADTARLMAYSLFHLIPWNHFGFLVELCFVFLIIDLCVDGSVHANPRLILTKRHTSPSA